LEKERLLFSIWLMMTVQILMSSLTLLISKLHKTSKQKRI